MAVKCYEQIAEASEFGKKLGAPARSLKVQEYQHKVTKKSIFVIGLSTKASPGDIKIALNKLADAYEPAELASIINTGLGLEAGCVGRERWDVAKPGQPVKGDVVI